MTCNDCIHEDLCMDKFKKQYPSYANKNITVDDCEHFKNKADFVEVVRCKDCKHKEKETNKWCKFWNKFCAYDDNYCKHGERRDT